MGFSFFTMLGKNSLVRTPRTVGTKTTWNVLKARPCTKQSLGHTCANQLNLKVILTLLQILDKQADSLMYRSGASMQRNIQTLASTGTSVPANVLVRRGVMTIAPKVDAVVIRTESATSPCAMYVATLDACTRHTVIQALLDRAALFQCSGRRTLQVNTAVLWGGGCGKEAQVLRTLQGLPAPQGNKIQG